MKVSVIVAALLLLMWILLALVVFALARVIYLSTRIGTFRAVMRIVGTGSWRRGYARYGQRHLAWNPLVSLSLSPGVLLPRTSVEVVGVSHNDGGTTLMRLRSEGTEYQLILSTGDYTGLVSWVDSAPPQESTLF